jgi:hypothetical protein
MRNTFPVWVRVWAGVIALPVLGLVAIQVHGAIAGYDSWLRTVCLLWLPLYVAFELGYIVIKGDSYCFRKRNTTRKPHLPPWGNAQIRYTFAGLLMVGLVLNWFFCIEPAKYLIKVGAGYGVILFGYMAIKSIAIWMKSKRKTHNKAHV